MDHFLGESFDYWIEVQKDLREKGYREKGYVDLIREITELRVKVSYYEKRIEELYDFMKVKIEVKRGD